MRERANYASVYIGAQLAPTGRELALDWAENAGDRTDEYPFEVPTAEAREAYVELQAFEVGAYGHELLVNGEALSGFDIPPNDGWQYWADGLADATLREGENTVSVARDADSDDAFAVGTIRIHWKEPLGPDGERP